MNRLLAILLCLAAWNVNGAATVLYFSQSGAGSQSGADAADALPISYYNTQANWGGGATQIGAGTTTHFVGLLQSPLTNFAGGTATVWLTNVFDPGSALNCPTGGSGADYCMWGLGSCTNTMILGGNCQIFATNQGDAFSPSVGINGIVFWAGSSNLVISNVVFSNLYVRIAESTNIEGGSTAIWGRGAVGSGPMNYISILGCYVTNTFAAIDIDYTKCTNLVIIGDSVGGCNWGIVVKDVGTGAFCLSPVIGNPRVGYLTAWDDGNHTRNNFHHDALFLPASAGVMSNATIYGFRMDGGFGWESTAAIYINSNAWGQWLLYNNIITHPDDTYPANGDIFYYAANPGFFTFIGIFNTTIYDPNAQAIAVEFQGPSGATTVAPIIALTNNLFYNVAGAIYGYYATSFLSFDDYNIVYPANSESFSLDSAGGDNFLTWAEWTASGAREPHGSDANPSLNLTTLVPSAAIPGISITSLAGYTADINGTPWGANWIPGALSISETVLTGGGSAVLTGGGSTVLTH